jgi:hypothetical protein
VALNRLSPAPKIPFPAAGSESGKRRVIEHRLRNGIGLRLLLLDVFADGRLDDPSISDGGTRETDPSLAIRASPCRAGFET